MPFSTVTSIANYEGLMKELVVRMKSGNGHVVAIQMGRWLGNCISDKMRAQTIPSVDFVTAMVTSVKVVRANRLAMLTWFLTIASLMGVALLTGLLALPVILPVLGHASWHLYRRAIAAQPA